MSENLLGRRFGALFYDASLVAAMLLFATIPAVAVNGGRAFPPGHPGYLLYLLAVAFFYFGWSWTRGGQTLGMKSWHLAAGTARGRGLTWIESLRRFTWALLCLVPVGGLGLLSILLDGERRAWHDRLSGTEIRLVID